MEIEGNLGLGPEDGEEQVTRIRLGQVRSGQVRSRAGSYHRSIHEDADLKI